MAGISQKIPSYVKGISQQPDELKIPGQLVKATNTLPDVTTGLNKRPGARLINPLGYDQQRFLDSDDPDTSGRVDGAWFSVYRSPTENYIGQINKSGMIEMWSCWDGLPRLVEYSFTPLTTNYPDTPENPKNLGRPGTVDCDTESYTVTSNEVRVARENKTELEEEIEVVQAKLKQERTYLASCTGEDVEGAGDIGWSYTSDIDKLGNKRYYVKEGYIQMGGPDQEINKPQGGVRGDRIHSDVIAYVGLNPSGGSTIANPYSKYERSFRDVNIYNWRVPGQIFRDGEPVNCDTQGVRDIRNAIGELEAELVAKEEALAEATTALTEAQVAFAHDAVTCGIYNDVDDTTFGYNKATDTTVFPSYLKHFNRDSIQTLTVDDYTFISNREKVVTMSASEVNNRPYEAYVDLKQVAYNRVYALDIYSTNTAGQEPVTVTSAADIAVEDDDQNFNKNEDGDACWQGTDIVQNYTDPDDSTKTGLGFKITVTSQALLKNNDRPQQGYLCSYRTEVTLLNGGTNWEVGDLIYHEMDDSSGSHLDGKVFVMRVTDINTTENLANLAVVRPPATSADGDTAITASSILSAIKTALANPEIIDGSANVAFTDTKIIGNGIYITAEFPFLINTPEGQLMNVLTSQCNNVAKLPTQCKDGYQVKVVNGAMEEDDYYMQFSTEFQGTDGEGVWKEIALPGIKNSFNGSTMPWQLVWQPNGTFLCTPCNWNVREAGDYITNPNPSFVNKRINAMAFYRNRLLMFAGEEVCGSRNGEYFNFWAKTALTSSDDDPIDLNAGSTYPSRIYDAIETNAGLLLFTANEQLLLTTDQDLLTTKTAKITALSSWRFNTYTNPVSMGANVGFVSNAGDHSRFFEMGGISKDREPEVLELSKQISTLMPSNLDLIAESKENGLIIVGKKYDNKVLVYRWFNNGKERVQSAWVEWELTGDLIHHVIMDDAYYVVVRNEHDNYDSDGWQVQTLQRIDLKQTVWSAIINDNDPFSGLTTYQIHMDNYKVVWPTDMQYYQHKGPTGQTYFRLPLGYYSDKRLAAYTLKFGEHQGRMIYPRIEIDTEATWCVLDGNWTDTRLMLGYEFTMDVEFPTVFPTKQKGDSYTADDRSSLIVHRCKLNLGRVGVFETRLVRKGQDDYVQMYEARPEDEYQANRPALEPEEWQIVPIYERNYNFKLHLQSSHPSPATLQAMTWEGDYSPRWYKNVG